MCFLSFFVGFGSDKYSTGNASQVSDGATAVLLTRRSHAKKLGLPIIGKYAASTVVCLPPRIMGVGPAYAIPTLLKRIKVDKNDVDFYEISKAFANRALYSVKEVGLDLAKVNPKYVCFRYYSLALNGV